MIILLACSATTEDDLTDNNSEQNEDNTETDVVAPGTSYDITNVLTKFLTSDNLSYKIINETIYIYSLGIPNHKSPYFKDTQWEESMYEDYNSNSFRLNPNRIGIQDYEFRIPLHPTVATNKSNTPMGAMGVSINGIPFYNQYAARGASLTNEIFSFDQYSGHPDGGSRYHYHVEPLHLTDLKGEDAFLGLLLDGFPVYGPKENGKMIDDEDLDAYHGHLSITPDFPNGIYHYHITATDPYINGDGFYGVAGTVSN